MKSFLTPEFLAALQESSTESEWAFIIATDDGNLVAGPFLYLDDYNDYDPREDAFDTLDSQGLEGHVYEVKIRHAIIEVVSIQEDDA